MMKNVILSVHTMIVQYNHIHIRNHKKVANAKKEFNNIIRQ